MKSKSSKRWAVHFAGTQRVKWALDEDLRWARKALNGKLLATSAWPSRILHPDGGQAPWCWTGGDIKPEGGLLRRQRAFFLCAAAGVPRCAPIRRQMDRSITPGSARVFEFRSDAEIAPYCADPKVFFPLPPACDDLQSLRRQLGLPADAYVVGSFIPIRRSPWALTDRSGKRAPTFLRKLSERFVKRNPASAFS